MNGVLISDVMESLVLYNAFNHIRYVIIPSPFQLIILVIF